MSASRIDTQAEALLTSASRLLADEGPTALTVRRIAAEAGVSTMGVYSRFGGKDGIVDALFCEGFERLMAALGAIEPSDDPLADLWQAAVAYREVALANATHYRIMFEAAVPGFEPSPASMEVAAAAFGQLVELTARARAAGRLGGPSDQAAAFSLWATAHGLVSLELSGLGPADSDAYQRTVAALVAGLALDDPQAPSAI